MRIFANLVVGLVMLSMSLAFAYAVWKDPTHHWWQWIPAVGWMVSALYYFDKINDPPSQ